MRRLVGVFLLALSLPAQAEVVPITLLHINDVYEITPVNGGKEGGIARVATLRDRYFAANRRTYTVIAGDFFSPSALGTARVDGGALAGRQMVDLLNQIPLAFATFGNHEFDLKEEQFLQRIEDSRFIWFSSNVRNATGDPFARVRDTYILEVKGSGPDVVRIGFLGVTLESNPRDYVRYVDPIEAAKRAAAELRPRVDVLIAVTHLAIEQDNRLATEVPEIDLILGGHEHDNVQQWRGEDFTPIFKADGNARSVYVHQILFDTTSRKWTIDSRLEPMDGRVEEKPEMRTRANLWVERAYGAFAAQGFDARSVVAVLKEPLDGRESAVRNRPTNLTTLIANALLHEVPDAEAAFFNSGSIRIDDQLRAGEVTQYDIIRLLPFGGNVVSVEMSGALLARVLDQGMANRGKGGFLQTASIAGEEGAWKIGGVTLDPSRNYRIATTDFLLTGKEQGLEFLIKGAEGLGSVTERNDIRFAVIRELQKKPPSP